MKNERWMYPIQTGLLFVVYFSTAKLGLMMDAVSGFATLVWPPTGIALAALLLFGNRLWPGIAAAAFLVNFAAGAPILSAAGIGLGNTLEALVGAYFLRSRGFRPSLDRVHDVISLIVFAALLSTLVSATLGVLSLYLGSMLAPTALGNTWENWWIGDVLGAMIVTPLLLVWHEGKALHPNIGAKRLPETIALLLAIICVCLVVCGYTPMPVLKIDPFPYLVLLLMVWVAVRFGMRTTVTTVFVISVVAVWATAIGTGLFAKVTLNEGLLSLHFFLGAISVTALILAAAIAERVKTERLAQDAEGRIATESRIRFILDSAYDAFVAMDENGLITEWNREANSTFGWSRAEALGQSVAEILIPTRLRAAHGNGLKLFLATGKGPVLNKRIELPAICKDGHEIPVEITISPVKTNGTYVFGAFIRDITHDKQRENLQSIQLEVTRILAEFDTAEEVVPKLLERISKGLNLSFSALWTPDANDKFLRCKHIWHDGTPELAEFERASYESIFERGTGLPGRVWESPQAVAIEDLAADKNFPRAPFALRAGLHGAVAFPVLVGTELFGIVEFLSRTKYQMDQRVLEIVADLGARFGLYLQRKRAELTLRESEERFRLQVDSVKDYAIYTLDVGGYVKTWNDGAERVNGFTAREIVGKHFSCFYPQPKIEEGHPERELEISKTNGWYEEEGIRIRKGGSPFWADVIITPLRDPTTGELRGFSKVVRDITERKQAAEKLRGLYADLEHRVEERTDELAKANETLKSEIEKHKRTQVELQQREVQLRLITNALPVLISYVDTDQRFRFINGAYEQWYGKSKNEMIGRTLSEVAGDVIYERMRPKIARVLQGESISFEEQLSRNGRERDVNITLIPDIDIDHLVRGFVTLTADISHHKSIERQLKNSKDAADAANHAKSAFLANMSHEIRTPLGAVLGFSELIANPGLRASDRANYVAAVRRNSELLSSIINDILDLSKVEAGKVEVDKRPTSLAEILTDITTLLNLQALEKGIKLTVSSDGVIPSLIETDSLRLRQILLNIVGNAIKFTERGSISVVIQHLVGEGGKCKLAFIVTDSGIGISAEHAAKLFKPFTQADPSTKRQFGGTGLGLILSKRLAQLLGGDVVLTSSVEGKGSTFTVTVAPGKIESASLHPYDSLESERRVLTAPPGLGVRLDGLKVLLVDDAVDNQLLIGRYLTIAGAKVETAENGKEAIEKAWKKDYNVLLMDLQMPIMDGYEATAELRRRGFKRPIIALTAHAMNDERQRCLKSGFDDHLSKPVHRNVLLERLARYTGGQAPEPH